MEECLHNMERECDLVGEEERISSLSLSITIPEQPLHTNYLIIESNPPPIIPYTLIE